MPHSQQRQRQRIVVPQRAIQGGFDCKFETDPYNVELYGLLSSSQYTDAIQLLNDTIAPARSNKVDGALLAAGPLLLPLAVWGVRHSNQTRRRKRLLQQGIQDFNTRYPTLLMRWNRQPESKLTIERRRQEEPEFVPTQQVQPIENASSDHHANGELISDVVAMAQPISGSPPRQMTTGRQQQQQAPELL